MDIRIRKYGGQSSPPPLALKQQQQMQQERRIPVVYYLCRNRHLEHPHFIEVPLSFPEGLYLRDVINRLNVLRGKGMPSMYSWSCKMSYKNGFVWHDLSEDDLILPTNGNEYVLKGSELFDRSPSERIHQIGTNSKLQNQKLPQSETPTSSRTQGTCSSSSPSKVNKESKTPSPPLPPSPMPLPPPRSQRLEEEQCRSPHQLGSSRSFSPEVYKPNGAADASTQTDDGKRKARSRNNNCTRGVSTDECSMDFKYESSCTNQTMLPKEGSKLCREDISPPTSSSSASSSGGKMETLESLIRADTSKLNSFRLLEEEEILIPTGPRFKAANVLMQLITCGSISVKDHHSFGLVPTYKPRFSHIKFPTPMFSSSMMLGELEYLSEDPRFIGLRMEDKEYFSGSLIETKKHKEEGREGLPALKRSSSYNAERSCASPHSRRENERILEPSRSKCFPKQVKMTSNKRNEISKSPISDCPRNSLAGADCNQSSEGGSKRFNDVSSVKGSSKRFESFNEEDKMIKIEERLTSGARVIIQSSAPCNDSEDSSSS